ncbi:MAG: AAA family ATPase [Bacteroidetes bacterium GWF2_43_63]|nr:MAG: AAA family ATPase [Bacteroidetes bacterium GWE2_42_42]OFY56053.1 MAG: AAA family ATPase [Bacteroidetes bacterium GWF2_43_63]HBG70697.1 AAA family ATPase [Bacteroidales bacterium]HCB62475.1 AAA family ATPase [Bacteroidales bacterium]HCY21930.1 AAA family ATPase [Bacteroidales bacterium]
MISRLVIEQVIKSQKERLASINTGLLRKVSGYERLSSHAFILCGIRRCGKSTVLQQIHESQKTESIYLNFEDPRLAGFDISDMNRLHDIGKEKKVKAYYFDEVQLVDQWEKFARFRLDEGYRIFITGSNATMLSTELGSKLTGRHISKELFPFSYTEFLAFTKRKAGKSSMMKYLEGGGFPEYIKTNLPDVLMQTFNDIIARDIAIRYNIKNSTVLRQLAVWLVTNAGKPASGNSLRKTFGIKSASTIMEYLSYFADAYLFFFVPKFSYSNKVQIVNPRKVYCIDNGFIRANSVSFSDDYGRLLENLVFIELRRKHKEIFYFNEGKECDFAIAEKGKITSLYQVCWQLDEDNTDREVNGLLEAMEFFGIKTARIITADQQDSFHVAGKNILVEPFHKHFSHEA